MTDIVHLHIYFNVRNSLDTCGDNIVPDRVKYADSQVYLTIPMSFLSSNILE